MIQRIATVRNSQGIHCRPSVVIMGAARGYPGKVTVEVPRGSTDLTSVLSLLSLELHEGTRVTITVDGPDEETLCLKLVELFEKHFDFPPLGEPVE